MQTIELESTRPPPVESEVALDRSNPVPAVASALPWRRDPDVVGRLEIPRLNIDVILRNGVDAGTLRRAVGLMPGTALPGSRGNAVLVGHRDGLFRPLRGIERGDTVRIMTPVRAMSYRVDGLSIVGPDDVEVLRQGEDERVTLITCYPFDYMGAAPRRLIVTATRTN